MDIRLMLAIFVWLTLSAVAIVPVFKKGDFGREPWLRTLILFGIVLAVALPVWRWRSLTYYGEINVDEGTSIAMGLKYLNDPIPWRSVDGITCGPLSTWISLWAPLVGMKLSYLSVRINALALIFACGLGTVFAMREIVGARLSFLMALPPLGLLLTTLNLDFLYFAMEYLPSALGVWTVYLILRQSKELDRLRGFWVGIITGAMPFTKLQASVSGVFLFLVCAGLTVRACWEDKRRLRGHLAWLCAGGLVVPILILVPVIWGGAWKEFLNFYIFCGASYKNQAYQVSPIVFLLRGSTDFGVYFVSVLLSGLLGVGLIRRFKPEAGFPSWLTGCVLLVAYLAVVLFSVFRSGFSFPHYLLLLIFPLCFLMAWGLKGMLELASPGLSEEFRRRVVFFSVLSVLSAQGIFVAFNYSGNAQFLRDWGREENPVVPVVLKYAKPGDSMAIWGWYNKLHAFSGIRPATRFIGTTYVTDPSENYNRHRELFISDVMKERPRLFVDAVDEFRWATWPAGANARHDMIPQLSHWIRQEYNLVADVQTAPGRLPVRIYVRKEGLLEK